jgi:glycine/D-amino acid oxidase-like deaminating enzyme
VYALRILGGKRVLVAHVPSYWAAADTVVLEANEIGWGASGRTGGFALINGLKDRRA